MHNPYAVIYCDDEAAYGEAYSKDPLTVSFPFISYLGSTRTLYTFTQFRLQQASTLDEGVSQVSRSNMKSFSNPFKLSMCKAKHQHASKHQFQSVQLTR